MQRNQLKYTLCFFIFSFFLSSCFLFRPAPKKLFKRAIKNEPYDVIIVPGSPYNGTQWSSVMKGRVIWANYLIKKGIAKNVIFSGAAVYTPYVEAKVMALFGEKIGIPKEKIFIEDKAQHGTENIYNSYWIAKNMGFTKIAFASDPVQSTLLMGFSKRRFKMKIDHIPFIVDSLATMDDIYPIINADSVIDKNFTSIVETQTFWHRFRGTRGKNIKFKKE